MYSDLTILTKDGKQNTLLDVVDFKKHEHGIVFTCDGERIRIPKGNILHFTLKYGRSEYDSEEMESMKKQYQWFETNKYQMGLAPAYDSLWTTIKKWWLNR